MHRNSAHTHTHCNCKRKIQTMYLHWKSSGGCTWWFGIKNVCIFARVFYKHALKETMGSKTGANINLGTTSAKASKRKRTNNQHNKIENCVHKVYSDSLFSFQQTKRTDAFVKRWCKKNSTTPTPSNHQKWMGFFLLRFDLEDEKRVLYS